MNDTNFNDKDDLLEKKSQKHDPFQPNLPLINNPSSEKFKSSEDENPLSQTVHEMFPFVIEQSMHISSDEASHWKSH